MTLPPSEHTLPAVHALELVELVRSWHVGSDALLAGFGLREEALAQPGGHIPVSTVEKIVERARALTGEPGLGLYLGLRMRVSSHGYLGFAAMTSATLREAVEIATRYTPTRTDALALRLHVEGELASLVIEERAPLGSARDVILFALMVGIWQIGVALTGEALVGRADFAFPEPPYFERFRHVELGKGVRFSQPLNQITFAASVLDLPNKMADPAAYRLVREQCERALDRLGYPERTAARVRNLVARSQGGFASLEEVARQLCMSARTLKRRLAHEGAVFSEILDEERRERALLLLQSPDLTLEQITERLGYSDVANFTRAFRRWTGGPPGAFRSGAAARARRAAHE